MMKVGTKRRRTKAEVEADNERELIEQQERLDAMAELAILRERVQQAEESAATAKAANTIVGNMIAAGVVNQDTVHSIVLEVNGEQQRFGLDEDGNDINPPVENAPANNEHGQIPQGQH